MVDTLSNNERFTGQDAILKWETPTASNNAQSTYKIKISNVSWSRDVGTSDVQHNGSLKATKALTDIRFSGSFEYDGQAPDAINALMYGLSGSDEHGDFESSQPARGTLTVKEKDPEDSNTYVYTFKEVVVTSQSRDVPSDDVASTTMDWEAEDMIVAEAGGSISEPANL